MTLVAVQQLRRMRGGSQSHLMLGADDNLYVVKFQNNPQHVRVLANELLASRLAEAVGLSVAASEVIEVPDWLIANTRELDMDLGRRREKCLAGLQFGSRYVGGLMPGFVVDTLPEQRLLAVRNLVEFAGILALDKWTCNVDSRQATFVRTSTDKLYRAVFIDHGYCFNAGEWRWADAPLRGAFALNSVYRDVTGWGDFDPWLTRIESMSPEKIWSIAGTVPAEWCGGELQRLEALVAGLIKRQGRVRELIEDFWKSDRAPFPKWV